MRQRFFTSTAQTRLIKNILANTPIPIYDTVRPGDYIIKNCKYIYNITLIKCVKSGTLEGTGEFISLDYTFYWGVDKLNHTERLKDATGFYDSQVHEWLGRYLRAYRDMVGVNLMPFYNCFSGVYTSRFTLNTATYVNSYQKTRSASLPVIGTKVTVYEAAQSYDTYSQGSDTFNEKYVEQDAYKILQIPIKLNRTYTIAVDCDSTVRIAPAFINHGHLVKVKIGTSELSLTDIVIDNVDDQGLINPISVEKTNTTFLNPFTIFINNKNQSTVEGITVEEDIGLTYEQLLQRYEKYLYLLIQLPRDNNSSIVVLEGDYTNLNTDKIFSLENPSMYAESTEDSHSCTAKVLVNSINSNSISNAPYVSYLNVEGLQFHNNKIYSKITAVESNSDYGYLEYIAKNITLSDGYYTEVDDPEEEGVILTQPGDVNLDGTITRADNTLINRYIAGNTTLNAQQQFNADINRDGKIDSLDSLIINRIVAHWDGYDVPDKVYIKFNNYISNFQIYSYIPINEGTEFNIEWYNPTADIEPVNEQNTLENNDSLLDEYLLSKLTLLQFNDGKNYPFADRLMEYLTLNVIDSADEISNNVKMVQSRFNSNSISRYAYGAWNNPLRISIYLETIHNNFLTHFDMNGYVDKTVESVMK